MFVVYLYRLQHRSVQIAAIYAIKMYKCKNSLKLHFPTLEINFHSQLEWMWTKKSHKQEKWAKNLFIYREQKKKSLMAKWADEWGKSKREKNVFINSCQ